MLIVVAAVLRDKAGRVLLQQRPAGREHGGLWEFPGGKVEPGEHPEAALVREIREELGVGLAAASIRPAGFATSPPGARKALALLLYRAEIASGEPAALDGQTIGWFTQEAVADLPVPPLDRVLAGFAFAGTI